MSEQPLASRSAEQSFIDLLANARTGSRDAQEELVRRFYARVEEQVHQKLARDVRIGRPWVRARFSTGDVVQEVFRSVLNDLDRFYGSTEDGFSGWLSVVVRNRIVDSIRFHEADCRDGRRALELSEDRDPTSDHIDPAQAAAAREDARRLAEAMAELGSRLEHLVRARLEATASFRELAEQLGYGSESSARRAFFGAQAQLVLRLQQDQAPQDEER
ncbi:MAG: sigma-70 family RNA polymerase sigma factor [Planctomycetota bacterium]